MQSVSIIRSTIPPGKRGWEEATVCFIYSLPLTLVNETVLCKYKNTTPHWVFCWGKKKKASVPTSVFGLI